VSPVTRLNQLADRILLTGVASDPQRDAAEQPTSEGEREIAERGSNGAAGHDSKSAPRDASPAWSSADGDAPRLVQSIIRDAMASRASDIHIEPVDSRTIVRFRIDGVLQIVGEIPLSQSLALISCLKVRCNMDIAEKRRPQDGSFRFQTKDSFVDVRVSTIPAYFAEKMVLRLLDPANLGRALPDIGLSVADRKSLLDAIKRPQGMILVAGPTGSGKTTTLYAALKYISNPRLSVMTIEDPIEYNLDGITQSQVNPNIGYTFANALRSFLRQDPDVIMVGEIRDAETAQIALRAAMTGHLVLSTVHTNDAATTITRLLDLDAPPFLVASSLSLVLAQRLVRRLCMSCRRPHPDGPAGTYQAVGCPDCMQTGYRGRVGVFETIVVDDSLRTLIHDREPAETIREHAIANGMRLISEDGYMKYLAGVTTLNEIERGLTNTEISMKDGPYVSGDR